MMADPLSSDMWLKVSGKASLIDFFYDGLKTDATSTAVRFDDGHAMSELSYSDLNVESDVISAHLAALSVENEIIGISAVKHVSSISIMLGILKIPASFAFMDFNATPVDYFWSFFKKLGACFIFIKENELKAIKDKCISAEVVSKIKCKVGTLMLIKIHEMKRKKYCYSTWSLSYAIQTSGSTGLPKVVKVPHSCIVPNVLHFRNEYRVTSKDVVFVAAPFTFDPGMVDIFLALSSGASALLVPEAMKAMPRKLIEILTVRNKITMMQVTPSLLRICGPELLRTTILGANSSLRILGLGGEPCPPKSTLNSWKSPDCKVKMYNVFGITEVSSWAMLYFIDLSSEMEEIPLGEPIMDTEIQVINKNGCIVKISGTGHLYIGGPKRICFLGWEDHTVVTKCPMRATGDLVRLTADGQFFYIGRLDDQINRFGRKIWPKEVEKITKSVPEIEDCRLLFDKAKDCLILIIIIRQKHRNNSRVVKERLKTHLIQKLSRHALPDRITDVTFFPLTSHGKINKSQLIEMTYLQDDMAYVAGLNGETICNKIQQMWMLNVGSERPIKSSDSFLHTGGDSMKAVYLCSQVEFWLGMTCPLLLDKLLNGSLLSVCDYLENLIKTSCPETKALRSKEKIESENTKNLPASADASITRVVSRGNTQYHNSSLGRISRDFSQTVSQHGHPGFGLCWKYDTRKCVDASPLVICSTEGSTAFIGSHSHYFSAILLENGQLKWEFKAGDRIESSACADDDGKKIFFGSYDQNLYCLDSSSGTQLWKFRSEGLIKSSPAYDKINRFIYFGSYDHLVYALNTQNGECVWKTQLGLGSVFSSVCLCYSPHQIYVGTLDGILGSLHPQSGEILWKRNLNSPIFSSCTVVPGGICVGCVDHTLNCFDHRGNQIWSYRCEGPVFSSPAAASLSSASEPLVIFGSHDNSVYCLQSQTGQLFWKIPLSSAVYSTSFIECCGNIVFICSTNGVLYALSLDAGEILSKYEFPGETFSSPVVVRNRLLVGCRDNNLYCLDF